MLVFRWTILSGFILFPILLPFFFFESSINGYISELFNSKASTWIIANLLVALFALDILLPIPSSIISVTAVSYLGLWGGAVAIFLGMSLGCLFGYFLGQYALRVAIQQLIGQDELKKVQSIWNRYGELSIIILRAVPILAETSVVFAGIIGMPFQRFLILSTLSNLGIAIAYSTVSFFSISTNTFLAAILGAIGIPGLAILLLRKLQNPTLYKNCNTLDQNNTKDPFLFHKVDNSLKQKYLQKFLVEFNYKVHFTRNLFEPGNSTLAAIIAKHNPKKRHKVLVFLDEGLAQKIPSLKEKITKYCEHHKNILELVSPPELIPGGEQCKNNRTLPEQLQQRIFELGIDRHSFVIGVGGGAVLDLVGYVASTVHRGIHHIRIPTTVLAQNDSGIGVKNGINLFGIKNFLGTFAPPFSVINDIAFIRTLDDRDKIAGMAEAVKIALIRDLNFFSWMENALPQLSSFQEYAMDHLIRRCAELHMQHITSSGDPFEIGIIRPLDFGHWAAHKLESLTNYELRHGEAVAIGIALDCRYSTLKGFLPKGEDERICSLLNGMGFCLWHPAMEQKDENGHLKLLDGLKEFREHLGGDLKITLLTQVGQSFEEKKMDPQIILEAVFWLQAKNTKK